LETPTKPKKPKRWRRRALITLGVIGVSIPVLWIAIHTVPGLGPALADGARALLGPKAVAWLEDEAYGIQDRIDRFRYRDAKPKTFWDAPSGAPAASAAPVASGTSGTPNATSSANALPAAPNEAGFPPSAVTPPVPSVASEGDGTWIAMADGGHPDARPVMAKTVVHPDAKRSFAAVAVVAIDLRRAHLSLVAGTQEPFSITVPSEHRHGLIPKEALGELVAAFNGGFKAVHGHYGMMLDGETFLAPRDIACTVALKKPADNGATPTPAIKIGTWSALKSEESTMQGYRQTPPCLVEDGKVNEALDAGEYNRNWGATVSGETVIRRSAIGVDATGNLLFYGLGEAVTAQALAHAMKAIGATGAAQLDVNYSYPRFLLYDAELKVTSSLIPGIQYLKHEYTEDASPRDFFYVTRKN
jgi:hypothetical protein